MALLEACTLHILFYRHILVRLPEQPTLVRQAACHQNASGAYRYAQNRVCEFHQQHGAAWEPAPLLKELAEAGKTFADFDKAK